MVTHAAIKIWFSQDGCTSSNVCNSAAQNFFHFLLELKFPKLSSIYSLVWLNLCIITSISWFSGLSSPDIGNKTIFYKKPPATNKETNKKGIDWLLSDLQIVC